VVDGLNIGSLGERELTRYRADKIGFVFQQFHLVPYLTALENVMLAQYFHSITDEKEASEALARWASAIGCDTSPRSFPAASSSAWPSLAP
jgi:putative ABC transport system ATP-binding protein